MSFWKKTMDYLGLGPDDAYDDYDDQAEPEPPTTVVAFLRRRRSQRSAAVAGEDLADGVRRDRVRTVPGPPELPVPRLRVAGAGAPPARPARRLRDAQPPAAAAGRAVAAPPAPPSSTEPATVRPRRFDQAQELADRFKEGQPVIMNLEAAERDVARRLIDFASGVCYALDGSMEKVATGVYLLKPTAAARPPLRRLRRVEAAWL